MELWIRSQDKEDLIKAYNFRILNQSDIAINVEFRDSSLEYLIVGKYATKERALEVLDDIQKFIIREDELSYVQSAEGIEIQSVTERGVVFEMPKE